MLIKSVERKLLFFRAKLLLIISILILLCFFIFLYKVTLFDGIYLEKYSFIFHKIQSYLKSDEYFENKNYDFTIQYINNLNSSGYNDFKILYLLGDKVLYSSIVDLDIINIDKHFKNNRTFQFNNYIIHSINFNNGHLYFFVSNQKIYSVFFNYLIIILIISVLLFAFVSIVIYYIIFYHKERFNLLLRLVLISFIIFVIMFLIFYIVIYIYLSEEIKEYSNKLIIDYILSKHYIYTNESLYQLLSIDIYHYFKDFFTSKYLKSIEITNLDNFQQLFYIDNRLSFNKGIIDIFNTSEYIINNTIKIIISNISFIEFKYFGIYILSILLLAIFIFILYLIVVCRLFTYSCFRCKRFSYFKKHKLLFKLIKWFFVRIFYCRQLFLANEEVR